jgi:hypothetical protein
LWSAFNLVAVRDDKGSERIRPLAAVAVGKQLFVVTVDHGYEDESYSLWQIDGSAIHRVLRVEGGGC